MAHEDQTNKADLLLIPLKIPEPYLPESVVRGTYYEVRLENIYDPSKFWIVLKYKELLIFMKYLKSFYSVTTNRRAIPRHELKKDLLCIIYRNGMYYRSIVLPVLLPDENKIRVFVIDFGRIINVSADEVYNIFKKHCDVRRFAIRACLANVSPIDQSKTWTQSDVKEFCEIIEGKRILAEVWEVDTKRCIVFVDIRLINSKFESANSMLVDMGRAVYNKHSHANKTENITQYKSKVKYLHLFPSFEALETGKVPCTLWEYNMLKGSVPLDLLYENYYQYQDINVVNGVK